MYWDANLEQRESFVENMIKKIDRRLKQAPGEERDQLNQLRDQIQRAGTDPEPLLEIQEKLKEIFGRRFSRRDEMKGSAAEPGEYLVKMVASGKTYTSKIMVRQDPLLDGQK